MTDELNVVNFTNIDNQDYEGLWGGEITIIKAGQTKQFPKFLAEHYCKHLVNKILIRGGQDWSNQIARDPLEKKILGSVSVEVEETETVKVEKEETFVEAPKEEVFATAPKATLHANEEKGETPVFPDIPKEKPKKVKKVK
jgi:hypothetical protein